MASNIRGLKLIKCLERYTLESKCFDSEIVLKKIKLVTASDGFLKGVFTVEESMCNPAGTIHGGYIASVIDTFCFLTQLTHPCCKLGWTTNMTVNYLEAAKIGEHISVESQLLKIGNMSVCEASVKNHSGALLVKGVTSFKVGTDVMRDFVQRVFNFDEEKM